MMITNDRLVSEYMSRLRAATADLPPAEREELMASIAEHIATSLAEVDEPGEAAIRTVLDRLGDPAAIAAEARGQSGRPHPPVLIRSAPVPPQERPGAHEWVAVAVLGVGSYLIPIIGTVVGIVMVLLSRWWSGRQKAMAVVLSLSGLLLVPFLAAGFFFATVEESIPAVETVPMPVPTAVTPAPVPTPLPTLTR